MRIWPLDLDLHIEAPRPQDRRVDHVLAVGGANHNDVLQPLHTIDLAQQLRDDGVLDVAGHTAATGAEQRIHLIEEHDDRHTFAGFLPRPLKHQPNVTFGFPDILVQQFRAFDVEEVGPRIISPLYLGDLLCQRTRHCLGDQRLAASGWPVEQNAFGCGELMLTE